MVVCTLRVVKMKRRLLFYRELSIIYIGIELLLTMLPNFEREVVLNDSAF